MISDTFYFSILEKLSDKK